MLHSVTMPEVRECLVWNGERIDYGDQEVVAYVPFQRGVFACVFPRLLPLNDRGEPFIPGYSLVNQLDAQHPFCQELGGCQPGEFICAYTGRYRDSRFIFTPPLDATHLLVTKQHDGADLRQDPVIAAFETKYQAAWSGYDISPEEDGSAMNYWILAKIPSCLGAYLQELNYAEQEEAAAGDTFMAIQRDYAGNIGRYMEVSLATKFDDVSPKTLHLLCLPGYAEVIELRDSHWTGREVYEYNLQGAMSLARYIFSLQVGQPQDTLPCTPASAPTAN